MKPWKVEVLARLPVHGCRHLSMVTFLTLRDFSEFSRISCRPDSQQVGLIARLIRSFRSVVRSRSDSAEPEPTTYSEQPSLGRI
jgi:hypothetical protein